MKPYLIILFIITLLSSCINYKDCESYNGNDDYFEFSIRNENSDDYLFSLIDSSAFNDSTMYRPDSIMLFNEDKTFNILAFLVDSNIFSRVFPSNFVSGKDYYIQIDSLDVDTISFDITEVRDVNRSQCGLTSIGTGNITYNNIVFQESKDIENHLYHSDFYLTKY